MATIGSYCVSKSAVHFITMAIRYQLRSTNIQVVEVLPPSIDTALNTTEGIKKMSPETCAKLFLKSMERKKRTINVGESGFLSVISRFFPKLAFNMVIN